jgi:hypothetical protein
MTPIDPDKTSGHFRPRTQPLSDDDSQTLLSPPPSFALLTPPEFVAALEPTTPPMPQVQLAELRQQCRPPIRKTPSHPIPKVEPVRSSAPARTPPARMPSSPVQPRATAEPKRVDPPLRHTARPAPPPQLLPPSEVLPTQLCLRIPEPLLMEVPPHCSPWSRLLQRLAALLGIRVAASRRRRAAAPEPSSQHHPARNSHPGWTVFSSRGSVDLR